MCDLLSINIQSLVGQSSPGTVKFLCVVVVEFVSLDRGLPKRRWYTTTEVFHFIFNTFGYTCSRYLILLLRIPVCFHSYIIPLETLCSTMSLVSNTVQVAFALFRFERMIVDLHLYYTTYSSYSLSFHLTITTYILPFSLISPVILLHGFSQRMNIG